MLLKPKITTEHNKLYNINCGRQYIGLFIWSKLAVLLLCCTVQLSVWYATVMVSMKVNTYILGEIKLWMFLTAQVQGVS